MFPDVAISIRFVVSVKKSTNEIKNIDMTLQPINSTPKNKGY